MKISVNSPCPCGSKQKYKKCCMPYHNGALAKTPLDLMRSRYSAYAVQNVKYIMKTTHESNPDFRTDQIHWENDIKEFVSNTTFEKLVILDEYDNFVVFKAFLHSNGADVSFIEKSEFIKENGKWYYLKGEFINEPSQS